MNLTIPPWQYYPENPTYEDLLRYMAALDRQIQELAGAEKKRCAESKPYPHGRAAHRELMLKHNDLRRLYQVQRERIKRAIKEIRKWQKIVKPFERRWKHTDKLAQIYTELIEQKYCQRCGYQPGIPTGEF